MEIVAKEKWNATGVVVEPGAVYDLEAEGEWIDLTIHTTPDGYPTRDAPLYGRWLLALTMGLRRAPHENWFCLIGAVGRDERRLFRIGASLSGWQPDAPGELTCFANDVWLAYWNNHGSVCLTVTRRA